MNQVEAALQEIRNGNELERERLIRHYKPYIIHTVGHICKRYVTWSSDEASIGLIAFNKALDTYDPSKGRTFMNYVYLLIQRDLIDFFRKEGREQHLSMDKDTLEEVDSPGRMATAASLESYQQSIQTTNLVEEILELDQILNKFHITFEELEGYSPKHKKTRRMLDEMAAEFIRNHELVKQLLEKRLFPMSAFTETTGYRVKTIERHRKYLITLILVKLHPEWIHLNKQIQTGNGGGK